MVYQRMYLIHYILLFCILSIRHICRHVSINMVFNTILLKTNIYFILYRWTICNNTRCHDHLSTRHSLLKVCIMFLLINSWIMLHSLTLCGISRQGLTLCGISRQGLTLCGISRQGLTLCGISRQGLTLCGISRQGLTLCGISRQGLTLCGISRQGLTLCGISRQGLTLCGISRQGSSISCLKINWDIFRDI